MMNGETTVPSNGRENEKSPVTNTMISDALKGLTEVKTAKINIEKVFVLNEKCFVKGIKPASSNVIQLQNSKSIPPKKDDYAGEKKSNENISTQFIEIKSSDNNTALQISGTSTKKFIISGSNAINDVETLKKLISQLANSKNNTNDQIKIDDTTKKIIIQNYEVKTRKDEKRIAIENEPTKPIVENQATNTENVILDETKVVTSEKNRTIEKTKDTTLKKNPTHEVVPLDGESSPEQNKKAKQKRFLYRLKSKNGRVLTYTSDIPIKLKKPVISVTKMTQADAERLSKQFAEETRKRTEEANKRTNGMNIEKHTTALRSGKSIPDTNSNFSSDDAMPSYGMQTRKRQIKFLPDGRVVKNKKSRKESFSSSTSLSSDDENDLSSTSDEDYNEFIDLNKKITTSKKISPPKKFETNTSEINKSVPVAKDNKSEKSDLTPVPKYTPAPLSVQERKAALSVQNKKSTIVPSKRPVIDPAQLLSSLLNVQVLSSQLNVVRFKPKNFNERVNNNTVVSKKVFIQPSEQDVPLGQLKNSSVKITTKYTASEPPPLSPIHQPKPLLKRTITSSPIKSASPQSVNDFQLNGSIPNLSLAKPKSATLQPIKSNSIQSSSKLIPLLDWPQDLVNTFKDFTDTRVVKTKAGPKKLVLDRLNETENPKTIYDIMSDIFDSMPSWNLHVLPENKSFCLSQVSRSRMGVPVFKKCVEINSNFVAKVYVHQLHCKKFDGVYDTESKLRKLISDIDALVA